MEPSGTFVTFRPYSANKTRDYLLQRAVPYRQLLPNNDVEYISVRRR